MIPERGRGGGGFGGQSVGVCEVLLVGAWPWPAESDAGERGEA